MIFDPLLKRRVRQIERLNIELDIVLVRYRSDLTNLFQLDNQLLKVQLHKSATLIATLPNATVAVNKHSHDIANTLLQENVQSSLLDSQLIFQAVHVEAYLLDLSE